MNKRKQEIEKRKILNQIIHTNLREGNCRAYASESESHIRKKFEVWLKLKKSGYSIWTEVIFKKGFRPDILAFKEGLWKIYEIVETESDQSLMLKNTNYPHNLEIIPIRNIKEIKQLEI